MFSIIITTYNSEQCIKKTLDNIFFATQGINKEVIVVDDGSTDNTRDILKNYDGIKFTYQINKGVSSARNRGVKKIANDSEFVTFIDDSDLVSTNFFKESIKFFEKNPKICLAIVPITLISNNEQKIHSLNYRFTTNKSIVNILEDYDYIHFHIGGVIFKSDLLFGIDKPFDESISFWEDAKLINSYLLDKKNYGLIKNATYFYNLDDQNSLTKISWQQRDRYSYHITNNFLFLINKSIENYGVVIKYIQYLITVHYLQFLLSHNFQKINVEYILENQQFLDSSKNIFRFINKSVIDELNVNKKYKYFFYKLKNINIDNNLNYINVYIHNYNLFNRKFLFSFSEEAFDISANSKVYILNNNKKREVLLINKHQKDIIHYLFDDFSMNIFRVHLSFLELFHKNTFIIKDYEKGKTIEVLSASIFSRTLTKFKSIFERIFKHGKKI